MLQTILTVLVTVTLAEMMFAMGLRVTPSALMAGIRQQPGITAYAVVVNYTAIPLITLLFIRWWGGRSRNFGRPPDPCRQPGSPLRASVYSDRPGKPANVTWPHDSARRIFRVAHTAGSADRASPGTGRLLSPPIQPGPDGIRPPGYSAASPFCRPCAAPFQACVR